jgi:hypothetical protein
MGQTLPNALLKCQPDHLTTRIRKKWLRGLVDMLQTQELLIVGFDLGRLPAQSAGTSNQCRHHT